MNRLRENIVREPRKEAPSLPGHRQIALGLLALSAPIIATNISRTVMSFVDFIMVSDLGRDAQAAITPASLVLWTLMAFGIGLAAVVNTFVSQSLGRRRTTQCAVYGWQGVYLSLFLGVAVLPVWPLVDPLFEFAGHGEALVPMQAVYTKIGLLGVGPTLVAAALSNFFNGVHRPAVGFTMAVVSNVFNGVANYALIFGHFGFPALGIAGAALGTLAASVLQAALLLAWFVHPYYRQRFGTWRARALNLHRLRNLMRVGVPPGLQFAVDIGAWTVFTMFLVGRFGEAQLAANNICFKILEISFMPAVGMGHAITAAVGRSIGQGRFDLARRYVRWGAVYCVGYMGSVGVVMAVFRHGLPSLLSDDPQVIHWAGILMIMCAVFQIFDALNITFGGALRGAGDTLWPAVLWVASNALILLGGGWLMAHYVPQWASAGVWSAATVNIIVLGSFLGLRYKYGPWAKMDLFRG
jgi:MATE family multidrug resistance protein